MAVSIGFTLFQVQSVKHWATYSPKNAVLSVSELILDLPLALCSRLSFCLSHGIHSRSSMEILPISQNRVSLYLSVAWHALHIPQPELLRHVHCCPLIICVLSRVRILPGPLCIFSQGIVGHWCFWKCFWGNWYVRTRNSHSLGTESKHRPAKAWLLWGFWMVVRFLRSLFLFVKARKLLAMDFSRSKRGKLMVGLKDPKWS